MTDRLKAWAAILVALSGFITAAATAFDSREKSSNDFETVKILAEQLASCKQKECE